MYEYTRLSVSFTRLNALDKAPFGDSKKERFGQSSPVPSLCPCHRSILHFMAYRHAETDPESGEGETLEASGWPDLAKQTKREWPTLKMFSMVHWLKHRPKPG